MIGNMRNISGNVGGVLLENGLWELNRGKLKNLNGEEKNMKKLEKMVKTNVIKLDRIMEGLVKKHNNKYIVFNDGEKMFKKEYEEAYHAGLKRYGEDIGFVVRKISKSLPLVCNVKKV
jgi:hypothetical protein